MKLDSRTLLEIVSIVQSGLMRMEDISDKLRSLDLVERDGELTLSDEYLIESSK